MKSSKIPMNVVLNLNVDSPENLIREMLRHAMIEGSDYDTAVQEVLKRESSVSTAMGAGMMLPHARMKDLTAFTVTVATLATPLKIETPDDQPVSVAVLLLIPQDNPMDALKFMADLAKLAVKGDFQKHLLAAKTNEEALKIVHAIHRKEGALTAEELMCKCEHFVEPGLPLTEATQHMMDWEADIVPVLDNGVIVGELSCDALFTLGIPDFFRQLQSVSFIRQYDPFEAYFKSESLSVVRDVMTHEIKTYAPTTTLIEIVFEISVKKIPVLYIVDADHKLLGTVNRNLLLERILNM